MLILIAIILASYAFFTIFLYVFWQKSKNFIPSPHRLIENKLIISVIIPVRNEARNILLLLQDLNAQTISRQCFEVLIIDDHSTDETASLIRHFEPNFSLILLESNLEYALSPKKRAIQTALMHSKGTLIVTTDGDCRLQPSWLALYLDFYSSKNSCAISGGVGLLANNFSGMWQAVEFSSLVLSGAVSLLSGKPTMANGANFAYTREAFEAVRGFEGNENLASGDDEFLLHKIATLFPDKIHFIKNPNHTVYTYPQASLKDFYAQRKRWGSKWAHYKQPIIKLLAVWVFASNLAFIGVLAMFFLIDSNYLLALFALKIITEWLALASFLQYLRLYTACWFIPIVQLTYPFYVIFFGIVSIFGGKTYTWKGRKVS